MTRKWIDADPETIARLERDIVTAHHGLAEHHLFSDAALERILDTHPDEALQIYQMEEDHRDLQTFRLASRDGLDSRTLLARAHTGMLWFNILELEEYHPEYAALTRDLFSELKDRFGFETYWQTTTLLVSSPRARVYFHADGPPNFLWHIRGRKRVWLYPLNEKYAPTKEVEKIFTRESNDDLPYDPSFDAAARSIDLDPGDFIVWPQNMPHRVENLDAFCVSLSTVYESPASRLKTRTYIANHYLRRWLHLPCRGTAVQGWRPALKRSLYRVLSRLPLQRAPEAPDVYALSLRDSTD